MATRALANPAIRESVFVWEGRDRAGKSVRGEMRAGGQAVVNSVLETFSCKDRDFVRLYFMDGLSPEEIAAQMEISVKTVYSKKHKIRCRLQKALEPVVTQAA